jgi:hypothetical protein
MSDATNFPNLVMALQALHVRVAPRPLGRARITVVLTDDYLPDRLESHNR